MKEWNPSNWFDQYQRLDGPDLDSDYKTKVLLAVAESLVGVPNTDPRVYESMYFWDPEAYAKRMAASQHKCALFALAVLRGCGYLLPEDGRAYAWRFGLKLPAGQQAPPDAMEQIRKLPGWKRRNEVSGPGTIMIIHRPGEHNSTHALVVEKVENGLLTSYDGGQKDPVRRETRMITKMGNRWCLRDNWKGNREILGWASTEGLDVGRSYMVAG